MKVFISHTFKDRDLKLSSKFSQLLSDAKIEGYLAEARPEYELLIRDKIKNQIDSSDWLVAIITDYGLISASVHEEIGYAIGKNIPIVLMVEEGLKEKGVLIYGKEPEYFTESFFEVHCKKIINFLKQRTKNEKNIKISQGKSSFDFLLDRNLTSVDELIFGKNRHYDSLHCRIDPKKIPNGKPFVLFSSCPKTLKEYVDVNSTDFGEWISKFDNIIVQDHKIRFLRGEKLVDLDSISFEDSPRGDGEIVNYLEFHNNGFFEQGISRNLIYDEGNKDFNFVCLHLCWLTGSFWAFLKFNKIFYEKIGLDEPFDVMLSVVNSKDLMLMGFGGKTSNEAKWAEPFDSFYYGNEKPRTKRNNIQLKLESVTVQQLTDEFIEKKANEFSNKISNAYGLESSRCYNSDGSFVWELMSWYRA